MGEIQVEHIEGPVLHAQCPQGAPVDLGGQILEEQPRAAHGRRIAAVAPPIGHRTGGHRSRPATGRGSFPAAAGP